MKLPVFCLFLLLPTVSLASDGVLEINQACAANTGCLGGDSAGFPVLISQPGSYRLTSNLVVPNDFISAITLSSSSVHIDLNGFEITRLGCEGAKSDCTPATGSSNGVVDLELFNPVPAPHSGNTVENGSITSMGARGVALGVQSQVRNVVTRWNRSEGISVGAGSTVAGCTANDNGASGIVGTEGSTISANTANGNGNPGIFVFGGGVLVERNVVRGNSTIGILLDANSAYRGNVSTDNFTTAISNNGVNLGGNFCAGNNVVSPTCP